MNNSLKGVLWSGLIFPGLGQVVFKHYKSGIALIFTVFASMVVVVFKAVQQAFVVLEKLELDGGVIDFKTITDAATQVSSSDSAVYNLGLSLIVVCWVIGIVDAYRIGKKKDL